MNCKHVYRRDWHCIGCDKPRPLLAENAKLKEDYAAVKAERDALRQALETIRDAGLEPIDPAYRELARAELEEGE